MKPERPAENGSGQGAAAPQTPRAGLTGALARLSTSRFNLVLGHVCDCAISVALVAASLWLGGMHVAGAVFTVLLGLFVFSFAEYAMHRWVFHGPPSPLAAGHTRHHLDPAGYDALPFFMPPLVMCALAVVFANVAAPGYALLLAGSIAAGYAAYGLSHTVLHIYEFRGHPLLRRWRVFHDLHHVHPDRNFGVTTGLWDYVLGTRDRTSGRD